MPENTVTITGNTTRDAELTFANSGMAIASFGVAINSRKKVNDEWVDGDPQFFDVKCFGDMAENVAESITKGTRVIVSGRVNYSSWETDDGGKRSKIDIVADSVGPDLKWATAVVTRTEKKS